jgi:hypothetical protein
MQRNAASGSFYEAVLSGQVREPLLPDGLEIGPDGLFPDNGFPMTGEQKFHIQGGDLFDTLL